MHVEGGRHGLQVSGMLLQKAQGDSDSSKGESDREYIGDSAMRAQETFKILPTPLALHTSHFHPLARMRRQRTLPPLIETHAGFVTDGVL